MTEPDTAAREAAERVRDAIEASSIPLGMTETSFNAWRYRVCAENAWPLARYVLAQPAPSVRPQDEEATVERVAHAIADDQDPDWIGWSLHERLGISPAGPRRHRRPGVPARARRPRGDDVTMSRFSMSLTENCACGAELDTEGPYGSVEARHVAFLLAHRVCRTASSLPSVGRCGHSIIVLGQQPGRPCRLRHGHEGWHEGDDGSEWNDAADRVSGTESIS